MSELKNFPMLSQLDGSLNNPFNCVPASICAGLKYLTGKSFKPEDLKTSAYGANYQGGTAASQYVQYCEKQGVKLYARSGDCIAIAREELSKGHPILFTQVDDYSSNPDFTHVCVWYKDASGSLTAMDPFGGFALTYSDSVWRSRLRAGEVWIMEKKSMIPNGWKDDGKTLYAPNGKTVTLGFRDYVLNHNWDSNNIPLENAQAANPVEEGYNNNPPNGTRQIFSYCELAWTSKRGVYVVSVGHELMLARAGRTSAQAEAENYKKQLAAATQNADTTALQNKINTVAQAVITAAQTIISAAQSVIKK